MFLGGLAFALLIILVASMAFWEWTAITGATEPALARMLALAVLVGSLLALAFDHWAWALAAMAGAVIASLANGLRQRSFGWIGFGLIYVAVPCAGFLLLRQAEPNGLIAVLFVLVIVWATDIAAFFGGRAIGGPKLWPKVSPKKTWSGALSGLAAAVAVAGLVVFFAGIGDASIAMLLAVPLSIASQAGDLFESSMKRRFGVKDSGRTIPGHGGVLDRVDGLLGAAALAWLIAACGLGGSILSLPTSSAALAGAGL
jgi:phosphatidate cytidylyltransferase